MNPLKAYQSRRDTGLSRIDTLLALYDAAIDALTQAAVALGKQDAAAAAPLLARAKLAVTGLAGGVDPGYGELPKGMLRLYEFVLHRLGCGTPECVADALDVLQPLREGLENIRPDALALERSGAVPPISSAPQFQASA